MHPPTFAAYLQAASLKIEFNISKNNFLHRAFGTYSRKDFKLLLLHSFLQKKEQHNKFAKKLDPFWQVKFFRKCVESISISEIGIGSER